MTPRPLADRYAFDEFVLDLQSGELLRAGEPVDLRPQAFAFLRYVVAQHGRLVTKQELLKAVWGGTVVTEDALRQCLMEVRRALGDSQQRTIRTIPRRGYKFVLPVKIDVPAVAATAGLQRTPDVEGRAEKANTAASDRERFARVPLWPALGLVALLAVAALFLGELSFDDRGAGTQQSAALPVTVMPGAVEIRPVEIYGAGNDTNALASVAQNTFVVEFNRYGIQPVLGAGNQTPGTVPELLLQGTMVREDRGHFVDVRLTDAKSNTLLWSRRFEDETNDASAIFEQAAFQTAYVVECGLFRRELIEREISPSLWGKWIRSCDHAVNQRRVEYYEQVLDILAESPGDAAAHSAHSFALSRLATVNGALPDNQDLIAEARAAAQIALQIDPDFAEALLALADTLPYGTWEEQEDLLVKSLRIDPKYKWSRSQYKMFLKRVGRLEESLHYSHRTTAVMRGAAHVAQKAWMLALNGDVAQALSILDDLEKLWPDDDLGPLYRFEIHAFIGDPNEAQRLLYEPQTTPGIEIAGKLPCWSIFLSARINPGKYSAADVRSQCPRDISFVLPRMLASLGYVDAAIDEIHAIFDDWEQLGHRNTTTFLFYPELADVRRDPRFVDVAARAELATYWTRTGRWPDFCDDPQLEYDCTVEFRRQETHASIADGGDKS